jgi:hypothetical protein
MELILERKSKSDASPIAVGGLGTVMITPRIDETYWAYRVRLTDTQSVVGFPKFCTVGIGFAVEEDWNTNLPYDCGTEEIVDHIWHNRGDESIERASVIAAVQMIREAAALDRGIGLGDASNLASV